jgi:hypothetical protein
MFVESYGNRLASGYMHRPAARLPRLISLFLDVKWRTLSMLPLPECLFLSGSFLSLSFLSGSG